MKEILQCLQAYKLYALPAKCIFYKKSIEFLGFILSPKGLTMDEQKVKTIQDWPVPWQLKEVQSFLGFSNFYQQFIHNYSDVVNPLTCLIQKGTTWYWPEDYQKAFETLKEAFTIVLVLVRWDPDSKIIVETNVSDRALVAILSTHSGKDIYPIVFHSRTFSKIKLNYNIHDKELLVIFEAFKKWKHYLERTSIPVEVFTDHKNLTYFCNTKPLSQQQVCWSEFL